MFDHLREIEETHRELEGQLADPDVLSDSRRYTTIAKRHAELGEIVAAFSEYQEVLGDVAAAEEMLDEVSDAEREMLRSEHTRLVSRREKLEERLKSLLVPKDPNDAKDVIVEIRSGAGGDEAALFAADLWRMYERYAESQGWRTEVMSSSGQGTGGMKEMIFEVRGHGAYSKLKHESGVHRVQRVPQTESQGRIHTSTATVAVLPAAEEVDVEVDPNDLRIDVYRSSGPGGQSVNTTDSAVRITHIPTGVVVSCQDEKSQHQNRDKAMRILRARLLQAEQERAAQERADARRGQIGTGDRSEKIRTYNFPDSRVTDHRVKFTTHDLDGVLSGKLEEMITVLTEAERAAQLRDLEEDDQ
jgi:peptide chain release factor 1